MTDIVIPDLFRDPSQGLLLNLNSAFFKELVQDDESTCWIIPVCVIPAQAGIHLRGLLLNLDSAIYKE